jgi:hypothetical protein
MIQGDGNAPGYALGATKKFPSGAPKQTSHSRNITGVFVPRRSRREAGRSACARFDANSADQFRAAERAAGVLQLATRSYEFKDARYDIDEAFSALVTNGAEMVFVLSSPLFSPHAERIAPLCIKHRLPAMFVLRSTWTGAA